MKKHTLIWVINLSVAALIAAITLSAQAAPVFTACIGGIFCIAFLFILSENMFTHDAVEFENRFWTLMAFVLARTLIFCQDSPMKFPDEHPGLAWLTVAIITFLAHNYERHVRREFLSRVTNIRKMASAEFGAETRTQSQSKIMELRKMIQVIDNPWLSSTLLNFFFLPRVLYVEHKIITILSEANSNELNLILSSIQVALMMYKVKDHKIARRFNRTKLLNLLFVDRVSDLNVTSKAIMLDGLQRMKLSAHPQNETFAKNIILQSRLDELSELKSITDSKGDVNSMHQLVYSDIRSKEVKNAILKYIAQQANVQASHSLLKTKASKQRNKFAWRKILSDVDDTLTCSGGSWPAGMDMSFPKKAVYPGVLSFFRELDLGVNGNDAWESSRIGNLAFLSARPHVYKDVSESVSYAKFKNLQKNRGLYTSPTLLAGTLDAGGRFMYQGDMEPLATRKFDNFKEYFALYPEYTCVFVGDNGQGDVRCGEMMLADKSCSGNMERIYIHQIQPLHLTYAKEEATKKKQKKGSKIYYFSTYIDAAIDAYQHKLILSKGLLRVMEEAADDFNYITQNAWSLKPTPTVPPTLKDGKGGKEAKDTKDAKESIDSKPVAESSSVSVTDSSSKPVSNGGNGKSASSSASKASNLATKISTTIIKSTPLKDIKKKRGAPRQLPMVNNLASMESLYWEVKRELRIRELNRDIERGNAILQPLGLGPAKFIEYPERFQTGAQIQTLFGKGVIENYRPLDGIYEVSVQWNCGNTTVHLKVYLPGLMVNVKN